MKLLDWTKNRNLTISDQLLCGIGLFKLLYGFLIACQELISLLEIKSMFSLLSFCITSILIMTMMSCILWFSTWLCLHFCLKIVTINQRFYVFLQKSFPKVFTWLLLVSILVSILVSLSSSIPVFQSLVLLANVTLGSTTQNKSPNSPTQSLPLNQGYVTSSCLSFLLSSVSAVVTITSLYRHMRLMRHNAEGLRSPRIETHISAAKTVTSLLAFNVFFFAAVLLVVVGNYDRFSLYCLDITIFIFHFFSSLNLIRGNRKLDKALSDLVTYCHCTKASYSPELG
ncbi:taste receptor type 2 member 9-like [Pelodytes ibericus]